LRERRARAVAAEMREALPVIGVQVNACVKREALVICRQPVWLGCTRTVSCGPALAAG